MGAMFSINIIFLFLMINGSLMITLFYKNFARVALKIQNSIKVWVY